MTTLTDITGALVSGKFTNDELNGIAQAVTYARAQLAHRNKFTLSPGVTVSFNSTKLNQRISGQVEKINRKFVIVNTSVGKWRVPANMLEAV